MNIVDRARQALAWAEVMPVMKRMERYDAENGAYRAITVEVVDEFLEEAIGYFTTEDSSEEGAEWIRDLLKVRAYLEMY